MRGDIDKSQSTLVPTVNAPGRMQQPFGSGDKRRRRHQRGGQQGGDDSNPWILHGRYPLPGTHGVCRLDGVGDIIFMEPAVRAKKQQYPDMPLVLYTRKHFQPLGPLVGFDQTVPQSTRPPIGLLPPGSDVCMALEMHGGSYALDRVSLWEQIFGVPITDDPVTLTLPGGGSDAIKEHPAYDPGKLTLFFAPLGIRDRKWSVELMQRVWPLLLEEYNVVVASEGPMSTDLGVEGAIGFQSCPMQEWFRIVGACDVALCHDTGAMYLAGGAGIPTVGTYEQVPPWLRMRRFKTIRGVNLRQPDCECDHHGPCTKIGRACYDGFRPRELLRHLSEAMAGNYGMWDVRTGRRIAAPMVEIVASGVSDDDRRQATEAARGLEASIVETQTGQASYVVYLEPGKPLRSTVLWAAIAAAPPLAQPQVPVIARPFMTAPRYAVVIPSHGRWDLTEQCLWSMESAGWSPETVMLVDDASPVPLPDGLLNGTPWRDGRVSQLRLESQHGFPGAVNAGVAATDASFVVILNNDVLVHEGGDTRLLAPLRDLRVAVSGQSGAKLNENWEYSGDGSDYIEFYCVAVRRSIWEDLGGLDSETFGLGYGEDADYGIRAQRAGYTFAVADGVCDHQGGATFDAISGNRDLINQNTRSLIAKHCQGRVLWAVASLGVSGGIKVVWNCAQAMREAGWETHLLVTGAAAQANGVLPAGWQDFRLFDPRTARTAPPFDIAIGTYWSTWEHIAGIPAKRRIGFVQSDEPEWYQDTAERLRASHSFMLPGFEHIVIAEWMREFGEKYGHNVVGVAQNGVDSLVYTPLWYEKREWHHRVMAVRKGAKVWFDGQEHADRAAHLIASRYQSLEYVVVGGGRVPPNVGCKVETVETYDPAQMAAVYNSASAYVLPSKIEGSSLTVLEAMACGTPVVCTPATSDAIIDRQNALVVPYGDPGAIADAVDEILTDSTLRWRLYHEGLRTAHERTLGRQREQFMEALCD